MKKIIAAAAGLMLVGTMATAASAVESQFGGYMRVRAFSNIDFTGQDEAGSDTFARTDTRTRLYYTAVFNENFKFVNEFEFDNVFGDNVGGDLGADGVIFEVRASYADFNTGMVRWKVGTQGATINRGFVHSDQFSGIYAGAKVGDSALLQFLWAKVEEKEVTSTSNVTFEENGVTGSIAFVDLDGDGEYDTTTTSDGEVDLFSFLPVISLGDSLSITPSFTYVSVEGSDGDFWYAGADVDYSTDAFSVWATGLYQGGEEVGGDDISAYLLAAGGSVGMFHGEVFYATGDDDNTDGDQDAFLGILPGVAKGQSYYWSEIMGLGMFDAGGSAGSPEDKITNILAANVGVKTKVSEKLTIGGDVWYAMLDEKVADEDELGLEIDLKATYMIMDNLNLDLVAAYLFAGDATGGGDEDPIEVGARLSLSF